jgi:hypothetical protein
MFKLRYSLLIRIRALQTYLIPGTDALYIFFNKLYNSHIFKSHQTFVFE